jgi:hypothetical protein
LYSRSDYDVVALNFIKEASTKHSIEEMQGDAGEMWKMTRAAVRLGRVPALAVPKSS